MTDNDVQLRDDIERIIADAIALSRRLGLIQDDSVARNVRSALEMEGFRIGPTAELRLERNQVEFGVRYASGKLSPVGHQNKETAEFIVQECPGSYLIQRTAGIPAGKWERVS